MALGAVGDEGLDRAGRRGDRARGAGDGRQRRLRAGPRPRDEPGQRGARDPRRSATTRPRSRRHGAAMVRGLQSAGVAATVKHFPGLGEPSTRTRITGWRSSAATRERARAPASSCRSGRRSRPGPRLAMSAHVAVPALTGDATLPATLSRAVMTDLLRDELGFDGRDDQRRARHAGARPGRRPRRSRSIAAIRAGDRPAARAPPTRRARAGSRRRCVAAAARGLFDADELAALERSAGRRSAAWLAGRRTRSPISSRRLAEHRALARELAERALTARSRGRRRRAAAARASRRRPRILAIMPEPTDLTPADTSSTVAPGLAAGAADAVRLGRRASSSTSRPARPRSPACASARRAVRCRRRRDDRRRIASPRQAAPRRGDRRDRDADHRGRAARRRGTSPPTRPGVPRVCTYSILPESLEALARRRSPARSAFPGRLPVAVDWRRRAARPTSMTPPRRDPRAARGRGPVPRRPGRTRRADRRVAPRRAPIDHVVIAARGTSRPRRDLRAVRARRPAPAVGRARDAVDRLALRRARRDVDRALVIGISQSGASPDIVAVIAAARRQGAPTIAITNDPASALAAAADRTIELGAGPELAVAATKTYTAELLAIACCRPR